MLSNSELEQGFKFLLSICEEDKLRELASNPKIPTFMLDQLTALITGYSEDSWVKNRGGYGNAYWSELNGSLLHLAKLLYKNPNATSEIRSTIWLTVNKYVEYIAVRDLVDFYSKEDERLAILALTKNFSGNSVEFIALVDTVLKNK